MTDTSSDSRRRRTTALVLAEDRPRPGLLQALFEDVVDDRPLIGVVGDRPAEAFVHDWLDGVGTWPANANLVVVGETTRSTSASEDGDASHRSRPRSPVRTVESPGDLSALYHAIVDGLGSLWHAAASHAPLVYVDVLGDVDEAVGLETARAFVRDVRTAALTAGADAYFVLGEPVEPAASATYGSAVDEVLVAAEDGPVRPSADRRSSLDPVGFRGSRRPDAGDRSVDDTFEAMSAARRRFALYALHRAASPVPIADLSREVAAWERSGGSLSERLLSRVHTSLRRVHLPKLADLGFVEVHGERETVELVASNVDLFPLLAEAARSDTLR